MKVAGGRILTSPALATVATFAGCLFAGVLFSGWIGPEISKISASPAIPEVVLAGPAITLFTVSVLVVHAVVVYGVGWPLRFDLGTLSVASQAAIGGPDSALVLSMSLKRADLQTHGIVVGILGYAVGNYVGFVCAVVLR